MANAGGNSCDFSGDWHENLVVDRDEDEHEQQRDDGDRSAGDFEAEEIGVHGGALLDGECLELSHTRVHEDSAENYGKHAN